MNRNISSAQCCCLCFVAMLSPLLRLLPGAVTDWAGAASWVSCLLSLLPVSALFAIYRGLCRSFPQSCGFDHILTGIFGEIGGKSLLFFWSLWLVFHSGFLLRSGADRFIATIYPSARPPFFIWVTAVVCAVAARGHLKPLSRSAKVFLPLLAGVLGIVIIFSLEDVEPAFLLPVKPNQLGDILSAVPIAAEASGAAIVNIAFLRRYTDTASPGRSFLPWLTAAALLNTVLCVVAVGCLGKTYTAALSYPFFVLARDLTVFSGVERIEALVVGLWLLPDFVLITLELILASDNLLLLLQPKKEKTRNRVIFLLAVFAAVTAMVLAPNIQTMQHWSDEIIPTAHLFWSFGMLPLLWLIHKLRRRF